MSTMPMCFVAMPFKAELNFFYLYVSKYLEEKHGIKAERSDAQILTKPLMDKIREQILKVDFVIGDVTGGNPNVFFELGLAQAYGKPVIFLCQDPPEMVPVDIRQFEFIQYDLARHAEFLSKLDNAVQSVFLKRYEALYEKALDILCGFNADTESSHAAADVGEFQARVMRSEQTGGLPTDDDERLLAEFLLPRIIKDATDLSILKRITNWLDSAFSTEG